MSIVAWIVLGLAFGVVMGRTVHLAGFGFASEIALGVSGCVAVGSLAHRFVDGLEVSPLHAYTLFATMVITVTLLAAHHSGMAAAEARIAASARRIRA